MERLYQEFDKQNPCSKEDAISNKDLEFLDFMDDLRQKCRDAGITMFAQMNIPYMQRALQRSSLARDVSSDFPQHREDTKTKRRRKDAGGQHLPPH
jgi:hypothetical protein